MNRPIPYTFNEPPIPPPGSVEKPKAELENISAEPEKINAEPEKISAEPLQISAGPSKISAEPQKLDASLPPAIATGALAESIKKEDSKEPIKYLANQSEVEPDPEQIPKDKPAEVAVVETQRVAAAESLRQIAAAENETKEEYHDAHDNSAFGFNESECTLL